MMLANLQIDILCYPCIYTDVVTTNMLLQELDDGMPNGRRVHSSVAFKTRQSLGLPLAMVAENSK